MSDIEKLLARIGTARDAISRKEEQTSLDYMIDGVLMNCSVMLKEQDAVAPEISESYRTQSGRMSRRRAWCGVCGLGIRIGSNTHDRSNYCERCGRAVKWE